jgi:sugar O-acyltransferase (sialic acid O-acetyltransferase NeuD family)
VRRAAIIGFGDLGRQIMSMVKPSQTPVVFDDGCFSRGDTDSLPFNDFLDERFSDCDFYLGLGYHYLRRKEAIATMLLKAGRRLPAFVHPSSHVDSSCQVRDGCVVYPRCILGSGVVLDVAALVNNAGVVSHDSHVGQAAYLSPGVVLSGRVKVGRAAFLGTGVLVSHDRRIGDDARIGIGSVVTTDVPDGGSAIGNPLRLLDRPLELG